MQDDGETDQLLELIFEEFVRGRAEKYFIAHPEGDEDSDGEGDKAIGSGSGGSRAAASSSAGSAGLGE